MASAQEIQTLLRFLSQDARVPLAQALSKVKPLQAAKLITPPDIAKCEFGQLQNIFEDEKTSRQVLNAAKRVCKKRPSTDDTTSVTSAPSPKKARQFKPAFGQILNPTDFERSLSLPAAELDESKLQSAIVHTNRAPLVLAFAVTLLQYTMPDQPLSSRLSLAHAVVSANSKTKAIHLGISSGKSAEDEGWGEGQPLVKVMGREIRVMKRWGYDPEEGAPSSTQSTQGTLEAEPTSSKETALWGIDLEALKKSNQGATATSYMPSTTQLPIFTAQSARAYLIKSFHSTKPETESKPTRKSNTAIVAERERNLGLLLGSLELLYKSWSPVLSKEELDKRAWGWYVQVRPEVASGAAGWGGKGDVKLSQILSLRRSAD